MLISPSPLLPNDVSIEAVALPTRIRNAFKHNDIKTVGDVRDTSDATLRSFQDFGRGSLAFCREVFGPARVETMDQFQLKQIVDEAITKHASPGRPGVNASEIAAEIAQAHSLDNTEEVEKMIHEEAANQGLKFVKSVPPS